MKAQRQYKLTIELIDGTVVRIEPPITISFTIDRTSMSSANSMNLQVYNLAPRTRNGIFQDRINPKQYKKIYLQAGYEGLSRLATIFQGNIFEAYSYRQGADIITYIHAFDGMFDMVNSYSSFTVNKGTSNKDLIESLIDGFTNLAKGKIGNITGTKKRGTTCNGNTFELLKRETGDQVYIDLEKVNVLQNNEIIQGELPIINSETGLLSTPRRRDAYLNVEMLFEPRVFVGQLVEIQSSINKVFNGQYKVIGFNHSATISEAVSSQAKTTLNLLIGTQLFGQFEEVE